MTREEFAIDPVPGNLGSDGLGAIFAELGPGPVLVGIRPRAGRAVESINLIETEQGSCALGRACRAQDMVKRGRHGRCPGSLLLWGRNPGWRVRNHWAQLNLKRLTSEASPSEARMPFLQGSAALPRRPRWPGVFFPPVGANREDGSKSRVLRHSTGAFRCEQTVASDRRIALTAD